MHIDKVSIDGMNMNYFKFGHGKRTLVILPGLSVQSVMMVAPAVSAGYKIMADDFTVYVFDRRENLPEKYTVNDMARDTCAAMERLNISGACVFGASQGGMIAMVAAAMCPWLVGKLALGSTACRVPKDSGKVLSNWIELAKRGEREALYQSFGEKLYPESLYRQHKSSLTVAGKSVTDEELERFIIIAEGSKGFDASDKIKDIKCPVLVIGAEDDAVLGKDATLEISQMLDGRADCGCYIYPAGYGHAVYDTAPDYRKRLYDFFIS